MGVSPRIVTLKTESVRNSHLVSGPKGNIYIYIYIWISFRGGNMSDPFK